MAQDNNGDTNKVHLIRPASGKLCSVSLGGGTIADGNRLAISKVIPTLIHGSLPAFGIKF